MPDAATIAREYPQAAASRDFNRVRQLFHPQYSYTGSDGQRQEGAEASIAGCDMFTTAFPDLNVEDLQTHVVGDVAIVEFVARGTHQGEFMGIAPTARRMSLPVCKVLEIRDDKIYAEREYLDMMHLMQQLGVTPSPATA